MSLYSYVNPVVAVILGWLILNERLTAASITGMAIILAGMVLVQTSGPRSKPVLIVTEEEERKAA